MYFRSLHDLFICSLIIGYIGYFLAVVRIPDGVYIIDKSALIYLAWLLGGFVTKNSSSYGRSQDVAEHVLVHIVLFIAGGAHTLLCIHNIVFHKSYCKLLCFCNGTCIGNMYFDSCL